MKLARDKFPTIAVAGACTIGHSQPLLSLLHEQCQPKKLLTLSWIELNCDWTAVPKSSWRRNSVKGSKPKVWGDFTAPEPPQRLITIEKDMQTSQSPSNPRPLGPLRHLIRTMRRHDLTNKNTMAKRRQFIKYPQRLAQDTWEFLLLRVMRRHGLTNKKTKKFTNKTTIRQRPIERPKPKPMCFMCMMAERKNCIRWLRNALT